MMHSKKQPGRRFGDSAKNYHSRRDAAAVFQRPGTLLILLYGISILLMGIGIFRGEFWETWQNGATL